MDHLSSENDESCFDDNGLRNVRPLASKQHNIVSSDSISDKAREESKLSNCDANLTGRDEYESTISYTRYKSKSCWKELIDHEWVTSLDLFRGLRRTVGPINDDENRQSLPSPEKDERGGSKALEDPLDLLVWKGFKKEGSKNVVGGCAKRSRKVGAEETKFRSGRSAKDGGCPTLEILSSPASFWGTSFAAISWQFSVSFTVGILLLMPAAGVEGALTSIPVNALFVVGQTARMNCSTDLNRPVYWARTLPGSDVQQWLYYGKNGFNGNNADGRFSIDKDEATGRYDVIIADVQQKDAGQYICIDESGLGAKASAELVVSDPIKCNSHVPSEGVMGYNVFGFEQDFIQLSCSLTYTGNLSPTLEWSWPGSAVQSVERAVSGATSSVTSTLKLSATKELNNVQFQCKANIEGATQYAFDSGLTWKSETVNVRYTEFASEEVAVCPGVKWNLLCNPQCSYSFERKDSDCQCLYTYYDTKTQQNYEVASDAVRCGTDSDVILVISIVAAVVGAFAVAIIIVLACCLKMKNAKLVEKHDEATNKWPPSNASRESDQSSSDDYSRRAMLEEV